ncbi:MAG: FAD-dependent monooxygenase [Terriglobia bacterium]
MVRRQHSQGQIAVIGGSAAGLFTAYRLACAGCDTRVFEGQERFDSAPRTLIVTDRVREILGTIVDKAVVHEIRRFELYTDGRVAKIALRRPDLVIERSVLIQELATAAVGSGARVEFGQKVISLEPRGPTLTLTMQRMQGGSTEDTQFRTVVAADGAVSRVAQSAGWPKPRTVPLVQTIVDLPKGMAPDTVRVWFIPDDTPYFYWLIPHSPTEGVVGLIGEDGLDTRAVLDRFLDKHNLTPRGFQGARIPVYTGWIPVRRQLPGGDVYLVGDAAGHVKVTTVGGIVTGFRGALGVADAILNGGSSRKLHALRLELNTHLLIRKLIHGFTQAHYSHLVDILNSRARQDLEAHTRDEPGSLLLRLCLHQPRMLLLGLRALITGGAFLRQNPS